MSLTRVQAASNGTGVLALGGTLWLAQSTISGNGIGFNASGINGIIESYGDNYVAADNGFNLGSLTSFARQ